MSKRINPNGTIRLMVVRETAPDLWNKDAARCCRTPEDAEKIARAAMAAEPLCNPQQEGFWEIMLSSKNSVIGLCFVTMGTLNASLVHPREVFRPTIAGAAASIVLVHNHPSNDPTPSSEDVRITRQLVKSGEILDVQVLDHVILGSKTGRVSMRETGIVDFAR